jgi:hypothetical protein
MSKPSIPGQQVPNHGTGSARNSSASTPNHLIQGRPNNGPSAAGPGKAHREPNSAQVTVGDGDRDGK